MKYFHILISLYFFIIYQKIFLCTKITRKHKHPGSSQSDNSNIEIEPLSENDKNLDNNKEQDTNSKSNENKNDPSSYYNEDDEFVYGKNEQVFNLDEELEKGQGGPKQNSGNIHNNKDKIHHGYDPSKMNPDIQRRLKEQQNMNIIIFIISQEGQTSQVAQVNLEDLIMQVILEIHINLNQGNPGSQDNQVLMFIEQE